MKCPLYISFATLVGRGMAMTSTDCLKEECGWWDRDQEGCSVHAIATFLHHSYLDLKAIRDKMPHEEKP